MVAEETREARLGILIYLLLGAALGASVLLGTVVLGLEGVGDAVGAGLHERLDGGQAAPDILLAFFVIAPLVALLVAALMGARAARTGHEVNGPAAMTTLFGLPILWINLAAALLLSFAVLDWSADTDRFQGVFDLVVESIVFLVLETAATVAFAALTAGIVRDAFGGYAPQIDFGEPASQETDVQMVRSPVPESERLRPPRTPEPRTPSPSAEAAPPEPRPTQHGTRLEDYPVQCPRCEAHFKVSGERPLRIECPACQKTGTIR